MDSSEGRSGTRPVQKATRGKAKYLASRVGAGWRPLADDASVSAESTRGPARIPRTHAPASPCEGSACCDPPTLRVQGAAGSVGPIRCRPLPGSVADPGFDVKTSAPGLPESGGQTPNCVTLDCTSRCRFEYLLFCRCSL